MTSNPDHPMGEVSPPHLEANTVLGHTEYLQNPLPTLNFGGREQYFNHHFEDASGPLPTPSRFEVLLGQEHEPVESQEDDTGTIRQSPAPLTDKAPHEMTYHELNYLVSHLSYKSERSQQAVAEIMQRPEYLQHAKSLVFATGNEPEMEHPISTPPRSACQPSMTPRSASQPSTTPLGPPPHKIDGLSHGLLSQPSQMQQGAPMSSTDHTIPSRTQDLAHAEELIRRTLAQWIAHKSASLPSWHAPTIDLWAIPSPVGAPIPTAYVVPPARDIKVLGDHTAFVPDQAWLAADRLPPAMGFIQFPAPQSRTGGTGTKESFLNELPASISKAVEGWRLAYWFRRFPEIELRHVAERITLPSGTKSRTEAKMKSLCNSLSMRHQRWCEREGGFLLPRTSGNRVSSKQLQIIERSLLLNGFEGLERNTHWALNHSAGEMVQPMLNGAQNLQGGRCIAPQRAGLEPRVAASLQMYIAVVKESRSRGLKDWRELGTKNWPESEQADGNIDEQDDDDQDDDDQDDDDQDDDYQDDDDSMQDNTDDDDDVQTPHTHVAPSVRAQTKPANSGAFVNQASAAQKVVISKDGRSLSAQKLQTVPLSMPPPTQQQRPISQRPKQPRVRQGQFAASSKHTNDYHVQSLGPIPHGLPLQPVIGATPPVVYTPSSTHGATSDNRIADIMERYDEQQSKDKYGFIFTSNQIFNQLVAQGVPWVEANAMGQQTLMRYTDAQRRNRIDFIHAHSMLQNVTSFRQNGAQPELPGVPVVVDLISPAPRRLASFTPHTRPTPSQAPNPKRMRFSASPTPALPVKHLVAARSHEPGARMMETDDKYDEDEDTQDGFVVSDDVAA